MPNTLTDRQREILDRARELADLRDEDAIRKAMAPGPPHPAMVYSEAFGAAQHLLTELAALVYRRLPSEGPAGLGRPHAAHRQPEHKHARSWPGSPTAPATARIRAMISLWQTDPDLCDRVDALAREMTGKDAAK